MNYGKHTESALPLLNLLDILTVNNVYSLHALKFIHLWHKGLLPNLFKGVVIIYGEGGGVGGGKWGK